MTEDSCFESEFRDKVESLKSQLGLIAKDSASLKDGSPWNEDLHNDLLSALELLCDQAEAAEYGKPNLSERASGVSEQIAESLDQSFSHWQVQLTQEFGKSITKEVDRHLKRVVQLERDLKEEREVLAEANSEIELKAARLSQAESRLARQRKNIAKELRLRAAEQASRQEQASKQMRTKLLAECREQQAGEIELLEDQLLEKQAELDKLEEELVLCREQNEELTTSGLEAEKEWRGLIAKLSDRLEHWDSNDASSSGRSHSNSESEEFKNLELELLEANQLRVEAEQQLESREGRLERLQEQVSSLEQECHDLKAANGEAIERESERMQAELEQLRDELTLAKEVSENPGASANEEELESQLQAKLQEIADLEAQNSDLAAQLAKAQVSASGTQPHVQFDQESLSWEERKALIMDQLESEGREPNSDQEAATEKKLEVETLINATQRELEQRDQEIAELRMIVEQQADTKQGVAIGAAAIAQMLDSDELISQERQKLKEIQHEWEEKLRQAEIDVSMERAKLARERRQLEAELEDAKRQLPPREDSAEGRTRKWLDHLGLREENRKK